MDETAVTAMVTRAAELIRDQYVFHDVAEQIAAVLVRGLGRGRYSATLPVADLASVLTGDLQSVNGDKHLRLLHHRDEIPDLTDEAAELAMYRRQAEDQMGGITRVERLAGNVGLVQPAHILFPVELSGVAIAAAMNLVSAADALVIDLRHVIGGAPEAVALFWGYLLDEPTHLNSMIARDGVTIQQSWSPAWVPGPRFGGAKPLWALTSAQTFSGGEEFAYNVRHLHRGTLVGATTGGGANARHGVRLHPHLELTIPVVAARNPVTGTNWEGVGIRADVEVPVADALRTAHRLALEHLHNRNVSSPALSREISDALTEAS